MLNISTILVIAGIVVLAPPVKANILTIREEQYELQVLNEKVSEAVTKRKRAQAAEKSLKKAQKAQKSVVKSLLSADRKKQRAQKESIDAKEIAQQYDAYYADTSHANGSSKITSTGNTNKRLKNEYID